jgi:hypothetical protein
MGPFSVARTQRTIDDSRFKRKLVTDDRRLPIFPSIWMTSHLTINAKVVVSRWRRLVAGGRRSFSHSPPKNREAGFFRDTVSDAATRINTYCLKDGRAPTICPQESKRAAQKR